LKRSRARIIPLSHIAAPRFVPKHVYRDAGGPPVGIYRARRCKRVGR
jgi:hypothetical protein